LASLLTESIEVPFHDDTVKVVGVQWDEYDGLTVTIKSKRSGRGCTVHFESAIGIRMLDELNLASWWHAIPSGALAKSWLHRVTSGGWFGFEATRPDFYSQHQEKVPEYLIVGFQECLSVFSHAQPVVHEARRDA
jgi:hypothetical protein